MRGPAASSPGGHQPPFRHHSGRKSDSRRGVNAQADPVGDERIRAGLPHHIRRVGQREPGVLAFPLAERILQRHKQAMAGVTQKRGFALAQFALGRHGQFPAQHFQAAGPGNPDRHPRHFHAFGDKVPIRLQIVDDARRPATRLQAVNPGGGRGGIQRGFEKFRVQSLIADEYRRVVPGEGDGLPRSDIVNGHQAAIIEIRPSPRVLKRVGSSHCGGCAQCENQAEGKNPKVRHRINCVCLLSDPEAWFKGKLPRTHLFPHQHH